MPVVRLLSQEGRVLGGRRGDKGKEREATGETKPADPLMLHFQPAEMQGNVYLNFPGRHSVLWQPYQTNTPAWSRASSQ